MMVYLQKIHMLIVHRFLNVICELLESLIDKDSKFYTSTIKLPKNDIIRIKESIRDNIFEVPPYLSIIEVKLDEYETYGESLYLCPEKLKLF